MSDASDEHHERLGSACVAGSEKSPKLVRSGLYQVRTEPLEAVPSHGDRDAGAQSQCAVSSCENDNCDVDQGLKSVQQTQLWNGESRSEKGEDEESGSDRNPYAWGADSPASCA